MKIKLAFASVVGAAIICGSSIAGTLAYLDWYDQEEYLEPGSYEWCRQERRDFFRLIGEGVDPVVAAEYLLERSELDEEEQLELMATKCHGFDSLDDFFRQVMPEYLPNEPTA